MKQNSLKLATFALLLAAMMFLPGPARGADRAEYPELPRGHWAYAALDAWRQFIVQQGKDFPTLPERMTRYEAAVIVTRLLDVMSPLRPEDRINPPKQLWARIGIEDVSAALRREFASEIKFLGCRDFACLEGRPSTVENRLNAPPHLTISPAFLHRTGDGVIPPDLQLLLPHRDLDIMSAALRSELNAQIEALNRRVGETDEQRP